MAVRKMSRDGETKSKKYDHNHGVMVTALGMWLHDTDNALILLTVIPQFLQQRWGNYSDRADHRSILRSRTIRI